MTNKVSMTLRKYYQENKSAPRQEAMHATITSSMKMLHLSDRKNHRQPQEIACCVLRFFGWRIWLSQLILFCGVFALGIAVLDGHWSLLSTAGMIRALSLISVGVAFSMLQFLIRAKRYLMLEVESATWLSGRRLQIIHAAVLSFCDILMMLALSAFSVLRSSLEAWSAISSAAFPVLAASAGLLYLIRKTDLSHFEGYFSSLCGTLAIISVFAYRQEPPTWFVSAQVALCVFLVFLSVSQVYKGIQASDGTIFA